MICNDCRKGDHCDVANCPCQHHPRGTLLNLEVLDTQE